MTSHLSSLMLGFMLNLLLDHVLDFIIAGIIMNFIENCFIKNSTITYWNLVLTKVLNTHPDEKNYETTPNNLKKAILYNKNQDFSVYLKIVDVKLRHNKCDI